jgi:uncharacterized protein DUF2188
MRKPLRYTKKLSLAVVKMAEISAAKTYHIISTFNRPGWSIVPGGKDRALRRFETKQAAISYAKNFSNSSISKLIVHNKDGGVENIIALKS